jgi:hypothetical protein
VIVPSLRVVVSFLHRLSRENILTLRAAGPSGFTLAIGTLIILSLLYGHDLEYRFEVAVISIDWLVLIISGILVSIVFNRAGRAEQS